MDKTSLQDKFVKDTSGFSNTLFRLYTGFGKNRISTERINQSPSVKKWVVLVPKIVLINNFMDDFDRWGGNRDKIETVICYDSIGKVEGQDLNILADEAHHCTENVLESMANIGSDERIFLSATITDEVISRINRLFPLFVSKYSLSEGIRDKLAPEQDIRVIKVPLGDKLKDQYWKKKPVTAKEYYKLMDRNVDYWKGEYYAKGAQWQNFKWMQAALARKNWMAEYKIEECKRLLEKLDQQDLRYICFVNSVIQAKELGGKTAVHSKQNAKINQGLIDSFNNFEINSLFSKDILTEGVNLEAVDCSVYLQLDGSEGKTSQKLGRTSARSEFPIQYVLIIPGTRDEEYFDWNFRLYKQYIKEYQI